MFRPTIMILIWWNISRYIGYDIQRILLKTNLDISKAKYSTLYLGMCLNHQKVLKCSNNYKCSL